MKHKLDCGDGGCVFRYAGAPEFRGGMRTNGGCRCTYVSGKLEPWQREEVQKMKRGIYALVERIKMLESK